jgi:hypothetical protein
MRYISLALVLIALSACLPLAPVVTADRQDSAAQNQNAPSASVQDPTQLGTRQIEVRTLDVPYDVAYRAATQAFFSIGFSITHSDKPSGILTGSRTVGVTEMKQQVKKAKEDARKYQEQVTQEQTTRSILGFVPYIGWAAALLPGSQPPPMGDINEPSSLLVTMLLQPAGEKQTQIRFKMQKDGEPVWDQTTIDRLWVTTQREAMLESGPPPTASSTATQQGVSSSDQKPKEPAKK